MATSAVLAGSRPAICWNCSFEFDPVGAEWCNHDPRMPNKACPQCGSCVCGAGEKLKHEFWRQAPAELLDELELLSRGRDRLGDRLVESGRLTVRQLVLALRTRAASPFEVGLDDVLVRLGLASREEVDAVDTGSGTRPLTDSQGEPYGPPTVVCGGDGPEALLKYIMALAAHRGACAIHFEPRLEALGIVLWEVEGARQVELADPAHTLEGLRAVVTVRPDVAVVFSLPDRESALLATQLAESAVVICKVAATSAVQSLMTLVDMGVPRHLLAGTLIAVAAQRLVRRVCRICRQSATAPPAHVLAEAGVDSTAAEQMSFWRGRGCPTCNRVGFRGRQALFELLLGTPELKAGLARGLEPDGIETLACGAGMRTLRTRALEAVSRGLTSFDEFEALRL